MSNSTQLPVLIMGAGISGLALAQGLHKVSVPVLVFERDPALNIRSQGYRVRISSPGKTALASVLPEPLFSRLAAACAILVPNQDNHMFNAVTGAALPNRMPPRAHDEELPLVADRTVLRSVLMDGLESFVEFGKEFKEYEVCEDCVKVRFTDHTEVKGSFLVGADGARSRVRKQYLPNRQFLDTEGRMIYGKTPLSEKLLARFQVAELKGMLLMQARTHHVPLTLLLEPMRFQGNDPACPENYVYWVLGSRADHPTLSSSNIQNLSSVEAVELSKKLTGQWHPDIRALFELQDQPQTALMYINTADPAMPSWKPSSRVTLIGDAVHVMAPTAGVGATTALQDAGELAKALTGVNVLRVGEATRDEIGAFEEKMRGYAEGAIRGSSMGGGFWFKMRPFDELPSVEL